MSNSYQECVLDNDAPFRAMKLFSIKRGLIVKRMDDTITFTIEEAPRIDGQPIKYQLLAKSSSDCIVQIDYSFVDGGEYFKIYDQALTTEDTVVADLEHNQIILYVECADNDEEDDDYDDTTDDSHSTELKDLSKNESVTGGETKPEADGNIGLCLMM